MAETMGGFVRRVGLQNRGVTAAVKRYAHLWPRWAARSSLRIADSSREDAAETVERLTGVDGIEGFELLCQPEASEREIKLLLEVFLLESDLPVLVKVPLARAAALAPVAVAAGAAGVVVGSPPMGAAVRADGQTLSGETFGPGVFPIMLAALLEVKALELPGSLIACGGVHTRQQARDCLAGRRGCAAAGQPGVGGTGGGDGVGSWVKQRQMSRQVRSPLVSFLSFSPFRSQSIYRPAFSAIRATGRRG